MQKIVIVANGAAYGSESLFNSLRRRSRYMKKRATWRYAFFNVGRRHRRAEGTKAGRGL